MLKDRLKTVRIEKGLTQKDVAEKLNVSQVIYQKWEKGIRNPKEDTIKRLAKALEVEPEYLTGYTGDLTKINETIKENNPTELDKQTILDWIQAYFSNAK